MTSKTTEPMVIANHLFNPVFEPFNWYANTGTRVAIAHNGTAQTAKILIMKAIYIQAIAKNAHAMNTLLGRTSRTVLPKDTNICIRCSTGAITPHYTRLACLCKPTSRTGIHIMKAGCVKDLTPILPDRNEVPPNTKGAIVSCNRLCSPVYGISQMFLSWHEEYSMGYAVRIHIRCVVVDS